MSVSPKVPAAPRLRAIREKWLGGATEWLEVNPAISAAGLVGSLGRGDADDWSDVDLLIVVPDNQVGHYADVVQLPGSDLATWSIDARHNAPRGVGSIIVDYVIDGLPLHVDWYIYPRSRAAWAADAKVLFAKRGFPRLSDTFREHLDRRQIQSPVAKAANAHRLLQVSLIPVAAKYVARRSADAGRMVESSAGRMHPRRRRPSIWRRFGGCSSSTATRRRKGCWPPPVATSILSKACCRPGAVY